MKTRNTLIPFFLGAIIALPLKIYQLLNVVDYSTGFYKNGNFSNIALPIVLALGVVAILTFALSSKKPPEYCPRVKSSILGIITGITAASIGYVSAVDLYNTEKAMFSGTVGLIYSCLGLISVLSFLFLMVSFFMANNLVSVKPAIMLPPVLWMGLRLVLTFFDFTKKANISENSYDILSMAFMLVFLLSAAKFMAGAGGATSKWTFASGACAALFTALSTIPRYVLRFSDKSKDVALQLSTDTSRTFEPYFPDLMLMIFTVGFLFYISAAVKYAPSAMRPVLRPSAYQQRPVQRPAYPQGSPVMPQQRAPMPYPVATPAMPRPIPPASGMGNPYSTSGAGLKVTDDFTLQSAIQSAERRYGGLDSFRENMLSGKRALEVLETSSAHERSIYDNYEDEYDVPKFRPTFTAGDIAESESGDAPTGEALSNEVDDSLGDLSAERDNHTRAPKEASISAASDESGEEYYPEDDYDDRDYPAPPRERRSVSLGSGRHEGKLSDRLNEFEDERARRRRPPQRTPVGRVPYDDRYDMYEDDYDDRRRPYEDDYDDYDDYDSRRRYYDDDEYDDDYDRGGYDDYDDEYDDKYDDYDDEYDDEYDDYDDDYYDDGYDDEGSYYRY